MVGGMLARESLVLPDLKVMKQTPTAHICWEAAMSRVMSGEDAVAWRAVIVREYSEHINRRTGLRGDYTVYTSYAGPFLTKGAASAAISKAKRDAVRWPRGDGCTVTVTGKVQHTALQWEDVA